MCRFEKWRMLVSAGVPTCSGDEVSLALQSGLRPSSRSSQAANWLRWKSFAAAGAHLFTAPSRLIDVLLGTGKLWKCLPDGRYGGFLQVSSGGSFAGS